MTQLGIFGRDDYVEKVKPVEDKTQWSYSRREVLNQCLRKYYFQYHAANKATKENEHKKSVKEYKKLSNKHLIFGNIIHRLIELSFNKKGEIPWRQSNLESFGRKMIDDALKLSKSLKGLDNFPDSPPNAPKHIFSEIVFQEVSSYSLKDEGYEKLKTSLNNFFQSTKFSDLRIGGSTANSLVEQHSNFKLAEEVTVIGKLDLAYFKEDELNIIDWKTGENAIEDSSLQLSVYALWASNKYQIEPEKIKISKAYVYADSLDTSIFNTNELNRAKARIHQDAELIRELKPFAKQAEIGAFDKCESELICQQCNFKRICYEK